MKTQHFYMCPVRFNAIHIKTYNENIFDTTNLKSWNLGSRLLTACCHSDLALQESGLQFVGKLSVGILLGFSMRARKKTLGWHTIKSWLFNDGILMSWFMKWPPYNWVVLHPQFQGRVLCQLNHRPSKTRSTQCLRLYFCQLGQQKLQFFWQRLAEKSFKLYHIFINLVVEPSHLNNMLVKLAQIRVKKTLLKFPHLVMHSIFGLSFFLWFPRSNVGILQSFDARKPWNWGSTPPWRDYNPKTLQT